MNWNKFNAVMLGGSIVLLIFIPLWGHMMRQLANAYNLDNIYALYLIVAPYLIFWAIMFGKVAFYFWNKEE